MDNFTYGLDIATAISVIGAAFLFIWNSTRTNRNLLKESQQTHIKTTIIKISDKLSTELIVLYKEIQRIEELILSDRTQNQDLTPYKLLVNQLPFIFRVRTKPLDKIYGNKRFEKLTNEFTMEMEESLQNIKRVTSGESDEKWDFVEVMYKPVRLTESFITKLYLESENLIKTL